MMCLSAIVAACSLQAASVVWGFTSDSCMAADGSALADPDGYIAGGTAMLFLGTLGVTDGAITGLDTATLVATSGQDADSFQFGSLGEIVDLSGVTSTSAGQAYTLVLVDANDVTTLAGYEGYLAIVNGVSDPGVDPMSGDTWAIMTTDMAIQPTDWQSVQSIPEPTSGLLLLLGMAGLALKRRRA